MFLAGVTFLPLDQEAEHERDSPRNNTCPINDDLAGLSQRGRVGRSAGVLPGRNTVAPLQQRQNRQSLEDYVGAETRVTEVTWADHNGDVPIIEGTVIRLQVDRLPGDGTPKPLWLWFSDTTATAVDIDRLWQTFLRRFDLEHTFRFLKQTLGWTKPRVRAPETADRWTWLIIAAHTQLRLARDLAEDARRPWEKRCTRPGRLTPARVRRGFRNIRSTTTLPAGAPKPSRPGPGRPAGSRNTHRALRHNPGKNTKKDTATNGQNKQTA